jgi:hypothetical protein
MTNAEKNAYIDADLCLMSLPAKMGFPGAVTRWDDLQFAHINSTNVVHDVVRLTFVRSYLALTNYPYSGRVPPMASVIHVHPSTNDQK